MYIKTVKGQEEIQNRTHKLPVNLRKLLIMVNGRSTAREMIERLTSLGDMTLAFAELEAGGFITFHTSPTPLTAVASGSADRVLPDLSLTGEVAEPRFNLDKAKSFTRSILLGAIGPSAGRRIERVEATTTAEELRVELEAIYEMLPKVLSKRQAEQTWKQLEPIMLSIVLPPL
ncbi:MAG TPA: hypothetical protein P5329_10860 [Candidatus Competibacteraceae bacterium]|nr:hypothetical protein [Candidatus Competibacteraceae bacterium]